MGPVAPVLLFLQKVGIAVAGAVGGLGAAASLGIAQAIALGGAVIAGVTLVANKAIASLYEIDMPKVDTDASRQRTVKSTTEPYKTIYGETLVSGPISYIGMAGTNKEDLYHVIALAGHEVTDITDIYFDNELIQDSQINGGSSAGGNVTAGTFGPKNSTTICIINKHLGTATQAADSMMVSTFADYTTEHQGKGIAYIAMKWKLNEDSAEVWDKYAPSDIKAIVKGKAVYDPRLDTGGYGDDPTNDLFITYNATAGSYVGQGQNPALVLVDYLINDDFGMGIAPSKIDWNAVVTAANGCDVSVDVPNGTQKRFTVNGVLFGTDSHRTNINKILSAMNGHLVYSNGKYILHAGIYEAPTESLNEDDLIGAIGIKTSFERSDRFNTIKGLFVDPAQNHKSTEFPKVQLADAVTRDNGEVLEKEVQFPMTNSSYMAQRLSNKLIQLSDQQKVVTFPANLSALRITAGDRVQVSVDELSWSNKVFMCVGWTFSDEGGVNLTLREDSSTSYADPLPVAYSTITATGDITDGFRGVPSPSGLSVTAGLKNNELNWVNPARPADYGTIYVYASPNGNFSSAVKIGETDGTQFVHDASNSADSVSSGDLRYYWVRAVKNLKDAVSAGNFVVGSVYTIQSIGTTDFTAIGASANNIGVKFTATGAGAGTGTATDDAAVSNLEPNADPNTTVFATVGRVNWADVSGSTNAPADNATVGAQISVNLYDADGSTVMNQSDVKNSVLAQEILRVEVETGDVLDLETGAEVDIQNLGDVAIYVSNQDAFLQGNISTLSTALSNLEGTVVDLTSGVSDIYLQATAPVAGVDGVPDPIPDFSRWYDTDDNNAPYYWTGSVWASLEDPRIGANAASITNLTANLASTNTNVAANTTLAQAKIQSYFQDAEPSGGTYTTGDLWFDTNDKNKAYRWNGTAWQSIRDTDIDAAVTAASNAQSTADGKIVTFYQDDEPTSGSSSLGDLWIDTNDDNKLYRYNQTGTNPDTFAWQETRDAGISSAISAASTAQSTADGKIVTFIQDDAPADIDSSSGDLWFDTNDKNKLYRYSGSAWDAVRDTDIAQAISDASDAQATADGKVQTFIQNDAPTASDSSLNALSTGDLWIDSNDSNKLYRYTGSVWDAVRDTGIQANADSISVLDSTVSDIDDTVTALSTSNTSLVATIDFITKVSDEDGDILEDETSTTENPVEIGMQDLTDVASATGEADQTLQTRVTQTEDTITIQSTELTLLNSILTDGSGNLTANANAVSALQTDVTQINTLDGTSTSANASALTALKASVEDPATGLSAVGGVVSTLTANVGDGATLVSDAQTLYAITGALTTNNWSSTQEYAVGDGVVSGGLPYVCVLANTNNVPPNATYWNPVDTTAALITENNVARIGYCVDANGDLTDHKNATLCVAAGNTWNGDAAIAEAVKALRIVQPDGTYATIEDATSVISDDVGDVTAQKFIKIDNNGRIAGYGLYSTTSEGTPDSEFVVVADRFSVVDPESTGDDPIQPFTVTSEKIFLGADVQVDGDLLTTGTTISNVALQVGSDTSFFKASSDGLQLGNETFLSAPFRVTPEGALTATSATITGDVTAASFTLSSGATLTDADDKISNTNNNAFFRFETTAGGDDVSAPDNTTFNSQFGRNPRTNDVLVVVNTASNPEVSTMYVYVSNAWVEKADFFTGDIIIDGTLSADKITVGSLNATNITGDIDTFVSFNTSTTQSLSPDDGETVIQTIVIPANTLGHTPVIHAACQIEYAANFDSGQDYGVSFRVRDTNVTGTVISTLFYTRRKSSAGTLENDSVFIFATDTKTTAEKTYVITAYASSGNDSDDVDINAIEGIAIGAR